jgi:hypothetical protein
MAAAHFFCCRRVAATSVRKSFFSFFFKGFLDFLLDSADFSGHPLFDPA